MRTPQRRHAREVVLMLWKKHFSLVKNFDALMGQKAESLVKITKNTKSYKWCHRCCTRFNTEQLRSKHLAACDPWELDKAEQAVKTYLPEVKNDIPPRIRFKDFHAIFDVPCRVTLDCETYREGDSNARVASFAYAAMGSDVYTVPPEHRYRMFLDRGDSQVDCVARGIRSLMELWADLQLKSQYAPKHALTPYEEEQFLEAKACSFCRREGELVREHCHFTGAYRGAACKSCNARLVLRRLPCLAHNFSGFDSGPVIRALAEPLTRGLVARPDVRACKFR